MKNTDFRYIKNGLEIPTEYYSDQPYIIQAGDGAWICVVTTGSGVEGKPGQHIVSARSADRGKTWSPPVAIEPSSGPEASYSVLLRVESRIYCFYNHNTDNLRSVLADPAYMPGGTWARVDSLGHFVYKYSDDNGITWSEDRFEIPIRLTDIDRKNPYGGKIRFGWNVGKAFLHEGAAFVPFHKIGKFGNGGYAVSEGVLLKCANIDEKNCASHVWETLPDGEYGLRTPPGGGPVSEEQSFSVLSDGSFYCVYRSIDTHPVCAYSRDGGHTWTPPQYKRYADGRLFRHNRAANFCWKCKNGKFLYWYHNHGGADYNGRNPVWVSGGVEAESLEGKIVLWSQAEILLYDDDPGIRMSYPDLVEEDGKYFISETQKDYARVHEIPASFFEILWTQFDRKEVSKDGLLAGQGEREYTAPGKFRMPRLQPFLIKDANSSDAHTLDCHRGFSLDLWIEFRNFAEGQPVFDSRNENGAGIFIRTAGNGAVEVSLSDIASCSSWKSDEGVFSNGVHHLGLIVDGGPKLMLFVTDGILNDGAGRRIYGYGRYNPWLYDVNGSENARLGSEYIDIKNIRVYSRALMTTEMIGNYRFGIK
jgi:hypothetical protein